MKSFLAIGGAADGKRFALLDGAAGLRVPRMVPMPAVPPADDEPVPYKVDEYRAETIGYGARKFDLMVLQGLTMEDAFAMIVESYGSAYQPKGRRR